MMESFPELFKTTQVSNLPRMVKVQEWELQSDLWDSFKLYFLHVLYQDILNYIKRTISCY